jgi:aldehyde dehydrogenase
MTTTGNTLNEALIADVVHAVLARLGPGPAGEAASPGSPPSSAAGRLGVFECVDAAVEAATAAQRQLAEGTLATREAAVECIRHVLRRDRDELARIEIAETRMGRLAHKLAKLDLVATVPGVEMLKTEAVSGDHGLTVTEYAPYGVIGVVTPVTHSIPTVACNAIMMIAAGNSMVCNPHPAGTKCAVEATRRFNREIVQKTGIDNLICMIENPTLESADRIFHHPGVRMLCVTGGPGVAKAALVSGKRAVVAGPGNPPAVVDETADIEKAAAGIIEGAAFDNNLLCIGEKEVFVVRSVADALMDAMERHGGHRLSRIEIDRLAEAVLYRDEKSGHYHPRKEFVGQDPQVVAQAIEVGVGPSVRVLFGQTDETSPFVPCEQMMPVLPIVPVADVDEAIAKAVRYEHGFRHTFMMWSRNVENLTRMGKASDATIFVKNGACSAGLNVGGEGYPSFSIASPTGEGVTSPLSFTRSRRCVMVDNLRIV